MVFDGRAHPSRIHILGHHDADGIVAAGVAGSFLKHVFPASELSFGIVDFHLSEEWPHFWVRLQAGEIPGWSGPGAPDGVAIVNFPAARLPREVLLFYADHHDSSFRSCGATEALEAEYASRADSGDLVIHDPKCPSCVRLLLRELEGVRGWKPTDNLREACDIADRIDRAGFGCAAEAANHRQHRAAAVSALCLGITAEQAATTARLIAEGATLDESLLAAHSTACAAILDDLDDSLRRCREALEPLSEHAVVVDWTNERVRECRPVRFAEYFLTSASYSARLELREHDDGAMIQVTLGRSPWVGPPPADHHHPHLGLIAESVGGGGHAYAAGFRVLEQDLATARRRALAMISGISSLLRPLEVGHPMADAGN